MALASFFETDLPRNEGTFRSVEIVAPEGSAVNPRPPAPMTMNTVFIAHNIVHAIWRALAQAQPEIACAGWGKGIHPNMAGHDSARDRDYIMYHWHSMPGGGAVDGRDGFAQIGHLIALGGLTLPNAEDYEQLYPVRFLKQEMRTDAAGPGTWRGGSGIDYEVEVADPATFYFRNEGIGTVSGWGINGGGDGAPGLIEIFEAGATAPLVPPAYGVREIRPCRYTAHSPGGGGWGDPKARDPARVLRDVRDGLVSVEAAREVYGVALATDGRSVDQAATRRLRQA
jgi:N-methylhydantoinase B